MRGADGSAVEAVEARLGRRTRRPGPAGGSAAMRGVVEVDWGRRQPGPVDMRNARGSAIEVCLSRRTRRPGPLKPNQAYKKQRFAKQLWSLI